jgi:hypothetical protein
VTRPFVKEAVFGFGTRSDEICGSSFADDDGEWQNKIRNPRLYVGPLSHTSIY